MNKYNMEKLQQLSLLVADVRTASANGTGVDLKDYEGDLKIILDSKQGTGNADNTLNVAIEDSADNITFAALSPALAFTAVNGTTASRQSIRLNSDSCRRYIRAAAVIAGTTPSYISSVQALGRKKYE